MLAMTGVLRDNHLEPIIMHSYEVVKQLLKCSVFFIYACWLVF